MKALIINYNRLTLPAAMADWLAARGCEPVFIDNASTYPPLLEYYHTCPYAVVRLDKNWGHTVVWNSPLGLLSRLGIEGRYIVTDPDLDLSGVPDDFLTVLQEGLRRYPEARKCGLSLEVNDLPDTEAGHLVRDVYEARWWHTPLDSEYFRAGIDTTLALYHGNARNYFIHPAIRTNRPYTARHVPWYYDKLADLPADEQYYFRTANDSSSGKSRLR
jgi:hypothetical protein